MEMEVYLDPHTCLLPQCHLEHVCSKEHFPHCQAKKEPTFPFSIFDLKKRCSYQTILVPNFQQNWELFLYISRVNNAINLLRYDTLVF